MTLSTDVEEDNCFFGATGCVEINKDTQTSVVQCVSCSNVCDGNNPWCEWNKSITTQKKIWGLVRQNASTYQDTKSAVNVIGPLSGVYSNKPLNKFGGVNWNQSSDRNVAGIEQRYVPRNRTRNRPGSSGGGKHSVGVDIKHNSYARFLARKKAKNLTTLPNLSLGPDTINLDNPVQGNKNYLLGLNNCYYCS
jgi:hypothetical protein